MQRDLRVDQDERHCAIWIDFFAIQFQRAWSVFDCRNVQHGELQRFTDLLCRQTHAVRRMHGLDHVRRQLPNLIINFLDSFTLCPQNRVTILQDRQDHFSSRVKAGKFLTPASFKASITLMIAPNEAFLSACSASVDFRPSGKSRTAPSSVSTLMARPSSLMSSFSSTLTIACSSSAGSFFAVLDSGRLI